MTQMVTYASWWPASVVLPDRTVWHRVRVYVTNAGLMIYRRRPANDQAADWHATIDFDRTPVPAASRLPNSSADIHTAAGLVVVTYTGGCGCGTSLKTWRPDFSTRVQAWPLTDAEKAAVADLEASL